MLIKTILLSIFSCTLLGFSIADDPAEGGQLLRTSEGVIIIPSTANVSDGDAKTLQDIMSSVDQEIGVLVVNGKVKSQNRSITMEDVREFDLQFDEDLIGGNQSMRGAFIRIVGRVNYKCSDTYEADKCSTNYKWYDSAAAELGIGSAVDRAYSVLDKYGYVDIK